MQWNFPHKWFRLAVVLSLAFVAFEFSIDIAATRSLCCSYSVFQKLADVMNRALFLWQLNLCFVLGLALISVFVLVSGAAALIKARSNNRPFLTDSAFSIAVPVTLFLAWTAATGHTDRGWAYGFRIGFIAVTILWTITLLATRRQSTHWKLRVAAYCVGALLSTIVPVVMVNRHNWEVIPGGGIIYEEHADSTRYGFSVLFAIVFWFIDVLLSYLPNTLYQTAPPHDESKPQQATHSTNPLRT